MRRYGVKGKGSGGVNDDVDGGGHEGSRMTCDGVVGGYLCCGEGGSGGGGGGNVLWIAWVPHPRWECAPRYNWVCQPHQPAVEVELSNHPSLVVSGDSTRIRRVDGTDWAVERSPPMHGRPVEAKKSPYAPTRSMAGGKIREKVVRFTSASDVHQFRNYQLCRLPYDAVEVDQMTNTI